MQKQDAIRFAYRAHAIGVAATFTRPRAEILEAQASIALPTTGGLATAHVENFHHRDIISFQSARTHAIGVFNPDSGSFNTQVTSAVEGLNILNVVTADRVVARLASRHFPDGREASILTLGSHFDNLRIAGQPVNFIPDHEILTDWDTFSKAADGLKKRSPNATFKSDVLASTVLTKVSCDGVEVQANRIVFPEFGTIFLGEILILNGERRLTMLRVDFGCAIDGNGTVGEVGGNGSFPPPF